MLYALIVMSSLSHINTPSEFLIYKDLDDCLEQKERLVKAKKDAHCVRLQEPASQRDQIIKDLRP